MVTVVSVIVRKHVLDVDLRFPNPRYVALHPMGPCIIRCECQPQSRSVNAALLVFKVQAWPTRPQDR